MARVALAPRPPPTDYGAFVDGANCRGQATGRGVLDGRTFAVKDLIDVAGWRTGAGNPTWLAQQAPAQRSAPVVEKALVAGATFIGKTVTDELAFSLEGRNVHYDRLINPVCPGRLPGGSSSGSAVAVAAGLVDFALGTDTGGSVRVPANFLGLFGFRPSHGAISLDGVVPFAPSYDTVGWFARDAELLADVGAALLPRNDAAPITKLLLARDAFALVDATLAPALAAKAVSLGLFGEAAVFDGEESAYLECYRVLQGAEIWQSLGAWITAAKPNFAADIGERFAGAAAVTADQVERFRPVRAAIRARFEALAPGGTAIVIPTTPCVALPRNAPGHVIGDFYRRALTVTSIAGHCGAPQLALPLGLWQGCPVGLSIIATRGSDGALLDLARKLAARSNSGVTTE
jgi:amidase